MIIFSRRRPTWKTYNGMTVWQERLKLGPTSANGDTDNRTKRNIRSDPMESHLEPSILDKTWPRVNRLINRGLWLFIMRPPLYKGRSVRSPVGPWRRWRYINDQNSQFLGEPYQKVASDAEYTNLLSSKWFVFLSRLPLSNVRKRGDRLGRWKNWLRLLQGPEKIPQ